MAAEEPPNGTRPRTIEAIKAELEKLAKRHSRLLDLDDDRHQGCEDGKPKKKNKSRKYFLEHRHIQTDFHGNYNDIGEQSRDNETNYCMDRFEQFAIAVCKTCVIPRKELFEAWAMALYVHHYFPPGDTGNSYNRVADLCSGHGLVSWAILFLDSTQRRTAVCIDKNIPKSCDIVERIMLEEHPSVATFSGLAEESSEPASPSVEAVAASPPPPTKRRIHKRWHWVEGDICRNISADSSTLIVGVHCCGTLSDTILDLAISSRSALALVPCCHTRRSLPTKYKQQPHEVFNAVLKQNSEHNNNLEEHQQAPSEKVLPTTLTDYIDSYRIQKLADAGFDVQEERIPSVITPKNRIIVATPRPEEFVHESKTDDCEGDQPENIEPPKSLTKARPKHNGKIFVIPLTDTPEARAVIESQSGRTAADLRNRKPPVTLSVSMYLPDPDYALTEQALQEFCNKVCLETQDQFYLPGASSEKALIQTHAAHGSHGPYHHPAENRYSRNFVVQYQVCDPTGKLPQITKQQAKDFHRSVCDRIEAGVLPGITLRQGIR